MMLEIINGFLLVYFVILCTLSALVPYLVKPIAACFIRPSHEEHSAWSEIVNLRNEQNRISMKEEFAAYSKIQRRIIKLESQLTDNSQSRMSKTLAVKGSVHLALQIVITLTILISMFCFRHEPLILLKGNLFPLTNFLKYPSNMSNAISTHVWVIIANVSIRSLIKPLLA